MVLISTSRLSRELDQWIKKMKLSGATGLGIDNFKEIRVGVNPLPVEEKSFSYEPFSCDETKLAVGGLDSDHVITVDMGPGRGRIKGRFRGGLREGDCTVECFKMDGMGGVVRIEGKYHNGKLEGRGKIKLQDGTTVDGFFSRGILHGFGRYFDKKGRLKFIGNHRDGVAVGTCWSVIRGGGCVLGEVDDMGALTGEEIAYIYPDFITVLLGRFRAGVIEMAVEAVVDGVTEDEAGIKCPIFRKMEDGSQHFRQLGDFDTICFDPLTPDPYETKFVEVRTSTIPGASDGLFAKVDIEVNTTVAFYNGSRARPEEFDPDTWETNNYKIFDPSNMPAGTIDIPIWAQATNGYHGSLAHKTNHSFLPNSQFVVFDHPKFGLIPCINTIADIDKDKEILVGYGYDLDESPDWYKTAWQQSPFAKEGVSYKDWLECNCGKPLTGRG